MEQFPKVIQDHILAVVVDESHETPAAILKCIAKTSSSSIKIILTCTPITNGRCHRILDNISLFITRTKK